MVIFYGQELLAPRPTPKLENHPLSAVQDCIFAATLHIRRPFLHPQPEDAPCRCDRDTLIMDKFIIIIIIIIIIITVQWLVIIIIIKAALVYVIFSSLLLPPRP
jgi:Ca2+/Na+ antiporter